MVEFGDRQTLTNILNVLLKERPREKKEKEKKKKRKKQAGQCKITKNTK